MESINVAEAKSRFSELISRAATGERFIIHRRQRPVAALIGSSDLERLERNAQAARRLALALGQDPAMIEKIERGEMHPVMAAFGLWREAAGDLANLNQEIAEDRQRYSSRSDLDL